MRVVRGLAFLALLFCAATVARADAPAPAPSPKTTVKIIAVPVLPPDLQPEEVTIDDHAVFSEPAPEPSPTPRPIPSPSPTAIDKETARPFHVDTHLGALVTMTAEGGTDVTPTFWINTDGPLALGNDHSVARLGARIGLSSSPGQTFDVKDVKTYKAAEVGLWAGAVIGHLRDVNTTLVLEGDFSSRLKGKADAPPLDRLVRALGAGVRFDARKSNASLSLLLGFDEAATSCSRPVICTGAHSGAAFLLYGQLPVGYGVLLTGDVTLSLGQSTSLVTRRDIMRLGIVADPAEALKAIKGKK